VRLAIAIPSAFPTSATRPASGAVSKRLTKTDATHATAGSTPASSRRSTPRRYASAAARYWALSKSSVTLTGTPAKIASSIAWSPSEVPGILMRRFGRSAAACSARAASSVSSAA
jgi:hypothetical protein